MRRKKGDEHQNSVAGQPVTVWSSVFLGNVLGSNAWMRVTLRLGKMLPRREQARAADQTLLRQILSETGLLGTVGEQQVTLALTKVQELDIRLVE